MAVISNYSSNTLISGTSDTDSIYNSGSYVTISASTGNDSIYSSNGSYSGARVTIDAG